MLLIHEKAWSLAGSPFARILLASLIIEKSPLYEGCRF